MIPDQVILPFPIYYSNRIIAGFGRGSAELGIPTANLPVTGAFDILEPGIYFGWCRLSPSEEKTQNCENKRGVEFNYGEKLCGDELLCLPMVMSLGWNPFYHNKEKAAEIHILSKFQHDFYGANVSLVVLGYIRPELDYTTKEALIEDINLDIERTRKALALPACQEFKDKV